MASVTTETSVKKKKKKAQGASVTTETSIVNAMCTAADPWTLTLGGLRQVWPALTL